MKTFCWSAASHSDAGRVRPDNEDTSLVDVEAGVFVVADGMGGHAAGEIASSVACRVIGAEVREASGTTDELRDHVLSAFLTAGEEVAREAARDPAREGMGTTCTVLKLDDGGGYLVGHIGDSRAYLHRGGRLVRLTTDHSWVQEQVDRGLIRPEDARGHPSANLITRAIGIDTMPAPDLYSGAIQDDDVFLLASDGLTDMISDQQIAGLLVAGDPPDQVTRRLAAAANEAGGADNITVVVVRVTRRGP